ncbi:MAG TPA: HesA/MoeB/ThiF family protein [Candidatus Binataceae bacterium]|nr:HesA/MoeB/ThiF family protein [Candidatus Binataceae bacterium]
MNGRILIIGAGGLGAPAAWAIARAGAASLTLVDPDPVELSNLARQVIYRSDDLGAPKVEAAARRLRMSFACVDITALAVRFGADNGGALAAAHDFIIDATDDPAAKFLINDLAISAGTPFIYGGVLAMTGQAMTVLPGRSACLRCLFEEPPDPGEAASCRDAGIIGPVAGLIAEIQAAEALRFLGGEPPRLAGRMLTYDAANAPRLRIAQVAARAGCGCGAARGSKPAAASAAHPHQ